MAAFKMNPVKHALQLPEIISLITEYLEPVDLINCRLVNKQWNIEARRQLTKTFEYKVQNVNCKTYEQGLMKLITNETQPPFFQNFIIQKYEILTRPYLATLGPFMTKLTYESQEIYESRVAFNWILNNCPNLQYLSFAIKPTCPDDDRDQLMPVALVPDPKFKDWTPPFEAVELLHLKTLIIKFEAYFHEPTLGIIYYNVVNEVLAAAPNLIHLEFPGTPSNQPILVPGIIFAIFTQSSLLDQLQTLCVGQNFEDLSFAIADILDNSFRLKKLKLNEAWSKKLMLLIAEYQPQLEYLGLGFNKNLFFGHYLEKMNEVLAEPTIYPNLSTIHLSNSRIITNNDEVVIKIKDRIVHVESFGTFCLSTILRSAHHLYTTLHLVQQINLRNMLVEGCVMEALSKFSSIVKLELTIGKPEMFKHIWTFSQLEVLVIHLNSSLDKSTELEFGLTGIGSRLMSRKLYSLVHGSRSKRGVEQNPASKNKTSICALTKLRSLEIINPTRQNDNMSKLYYMSRHRSFYLTKKTINKCLMKMPSLTSLRVPYQGPASSFRRLKRKNPSLYLENTLLDNESKKSRTA